MADDDNQLLSNDDLDALFAGGGGGDAAKAEPAAPAGEPTLLGAAGGGAMADDVDAMQLDQASIDALFSGGMPTAPPSAPKLTPRPPMTEPKPAPAARAGASPAAGPGARPGKATQVGDLDLLAEVVLVLSAEIGRTDMSISDVLKLRPGSIVELDKLAGEPVELYVNDRCIARGEVVVVDDSFGVRVTELGDA